MDYSDSLERSLVPSEQASLNAAYNLKDSHQHSKISFVFQLPRYLAIVREAAPKANDRPPEHVLYLFEEGNIASPCFSYVLQPGNIPIAISGITMTNSFRSPCPVIFLVIKDRLNKISLQYVLVNHKKFKNIMFSVASLEGSPNYLRTRRVGSDFDLMFNVGNCKFVYVRNKDSEVNWYNNIKESHTMYNLFRPGEAVNRECVDFTHEIKQTNSESSTVCFLVRSDTFYSVIQSKLDFDSIGGKWRFRDMISVIEDFSSSTIYKSMIFNSIDKMLFLLGVGHREDYHAEFSVMSVVYGEIEQEGKNTSIENTRDSSHSQLHNQSQNPKSYPFITQITALLNLYRDKVKMIRKRSIADQEEAIRNTFENVRMLVVTEQIVDSLEKSEQGSSSLVVVGEENCLYRLTQMRQKCFIDRLDLSQYPALHAEKDDPKDRCYISSLTKLSIKPLVQGKTADYVFTVSKGIVVKMILKTYDPQAAKANGKKFFGLLEN